MMRHKALVRKARAFVDKRKMCIRDSCTASQPGKPDRYRCLQGADAERTDGWRIRYRFPSDNAEESISLWSAS